MMELLIELSKPAENWVMSGLPTIHQRLCQVGENEPEKRLLVMNH